jgi:hypothetical protein
VGGLVEVAGGSARDHGGALDPLRAVCEDDRFAPEPIPDAPGELLG